MSSPSPCMKKNQKIMNHNKNCTEVPDRSFTSVQMVHTHTIFHTPSFSTPSFTHHFFSHHLSHTPLCLTPSFTTPSFTHNFVAHHLSPHHLSHTHNFVTHHLSPHHLLDTTLSHTIFYTPSLSHALFHTQLCHTHHLSLSHTIFHIQLCHPQLCFTS